jgi:hypothetical protein
MELGPSPDTIVTIWGVSLAIFFVVVGVVAFLLLQIFRSAQAVHDVVSDIWTVGQKVANNTIHIALLRRTNAVAGRILTSAVGVVHATAAIEAHARDCPGCPACVLKSGGAR